MNVHSLRRRAALVALLLVSACATAGQNGTSNASAARPRTTVVVRNTNFSAFTIYAVNGTERRRLGVVQPASSATFVIPAGMVVGTTSLRFLADPIGSDAVSSTYNLPVHEGDTLELTVN